jgi:hypothetical protein
MTKAQVEVITSVQRRRHWSRMEKERIVAGRWSPARLPLRLHVQLDPCQPIVPLAPTAL